jgi:hypothetical protein
MLRVILLGRNLRREKSLLIGIRDPLSASQHRATSVASDGQKPRLERTRLVPVIQMPKDSSERFLNCILGIVTMAKHLVANSKY